MKTQKLIKINGIIYLMTINYNRKGIVKTTRIRMTTLKNIKLETLGDVQDELQASDSN